MPCFQVRVAAALLPVLVFASALVALRAQEFPRPDAPREPEVDRNASPEERKQQEELDKQAKEGFIVRLRPGERLITPEELAKERLHPRPVEIHWEKNAAGNPRYVAYRIKDGKRTVLTQAQILALYHDGQNVVNTGAATQDPEWHRFTAPLADRTVIHEEESANRSNADLDWAMEVAGRPLDPAKTVVFTALPQQSLPRASFAERQRMQIGGSGEAWAQLNGKIEKSGAKFAPAKVATKDALLKEFETGTSNVVLVYAHFDGNTLHMPDSDGKQGEGISMADFAALADRADAKDRVIILVACSTAKAAAGETSLVSLLLKKRLARAVFATAFPIDAQHIPDFLKNISAGKLPTQADPQLRQYVELNGEINWDELSLKRRFENEVTLHG